MARPLGSRRDPDRYKRQKQVNVALTAAEKGDRLRFRCLKCSRRWQWLRKESHRCPLCGAENSVEPA